MNMRFKYSNCFLTFLGLLVASNVSLAADACDNIKSGGSLGTYAVYYPSSGTTCTWDYSPKITRQDTMIDMVGTLSNGHLNAKGFLDGILLRPNGEFSKKSSGSGTNCLNGGTVEFLGTCINGKLDLTLMQVNVPAIGSVLGNTLIGNGKFQTNSSTFNFRVEAKNK